MTARYGVMGRVLKGPGGARRVGSAPQGPRAAWRIKSSTFSTLRAVGRTATGAEQIANWRSVRE